MTDYRMEGLGFTHEGAKEPTLQNVSAEILAGKTTLLLGESGAGKTTLIEVLAHIAPEYRPGEISGRFLCGPARWEELQLKQMARHIGLVFQNPESQFCTYTVADELAFGLENLCVPPAEIEERADEALSLLGIAHLKARPLHTLSGGEKQRVAIASALVPGPPLLIFDEPTSNLDPAGIREIFEMITRLKTQAGKTILIVEHQLEHLVDKADHLLVLNSGGSLLFSGGMEEGLRFLTEQPGLNVHLPPAIEFYRQAHARPAHPALAAQAVARFIETEARTLEVPLPAAHIPAASSVMDAKPEASANGQTVLFARGLGISLAGQPVLHGIDLDIHEEDFMAIVGPNGAGKTTLLHSLLGIYPDAKGEISLFGKNLKKQRKEKWNHAGIAFQNPEWQFVASSVQEEILYSLKKAKMTRREKEQAARQSLEQFGLWEKREQSPFVLSQGEKRRLSVAAILMRKQKLLFLDEPTFGQDLRNQNELMVLMQALNKGGIAIVMVSHNMDLVYRYCNRAVLLVNGGVAFDGAPEALFANKALCETGRLERPFWMQVGQSLPTTPLLRSAEDAVRQYSL